jgi:hypothetical protein
MKLHTLYTAVSMALLSGCSFVTTQDGEQLRNKAHQPICLTDCHITLTTSEGDAPADPAPAKAKPEEDK